MLSIIAMYRNSKEILDMKISNHMLQLNDTCGNQWRDYVMTLMQSITKYMIRYNRAGRKDIWTFL